MKPDQRFALIAGAGDMPLLLADSAKKTGTPFIAVALTEAALVPLEGLADKVYHLSIAQVGKIIGTIKKENINKVIFIGKVKKDLLFEKIRFDLKALKLLNSLRNRNDDTIMEAIVKAFAEEGIEVLNQTLYLSHMMEPSGLLTAKKPDVRQIRDIQYGMDMAKKIAGLDIGQTVVVKDRSIMAIEAIEGTDEAIIRGGLLAKKGAVVIKVAKPSQDLRFDIPTVGTTTIESMIKGRCLTLAIEADTTFLVHRKKFIADAQAAGISVVSYSDGMFS